jgi:undecaprenyl-diphosphatase
MSFNRDRRLEVLSVMAGSFAVLTFLVWNEDTIVLDIALRNWALGFNTPTSVAVWEGISFMGSVAVLSSLTFLSLGIFAMRHDWQAVRLLALAMSGAVGIDTILKWLVQRPRPDEVYAHTLPTTYSFPSGHALYSFTFYLAIAWIVGRLTWNNWTKSAWGAAIIMVVMIGTSRIFLGVHYSSDVLGGYLVAASWLMFLSTRIVTDKP